MSLGIRACQRRKFKCSVRGYIRNSFIDGGSAFSFAIDLRNKDSFNKAAKVLYESTYLVSVTVFHLT